MAYDLPSCKDCKRLVYEGHKTGRAILKRSNLGRTFDRPASMPTPCHECPKIPFNKRSVVQAGDSSLATEPNERQLQALHYYRLMKYDRAGRLPYDLLTLSNNVLVSMAEEEAKEYRSRQQQLIVVDAKR